MVLMKICVELLLVSDDWCKCKYSLNFKYTIFKAYFVGHGNAEYCCIFSQIQTNICMHTKVNIFRFRMLAAGSLKEEGGTGLSQSTKCCWDCI